MSRRLPVVVILLGVVVAGLVIDRAGDDDSGVVAETAAVEDLPFPIASDPGGLSSTWFCAGGTGEEDGFADHVVEVTNPADVAVSVSMTVFGGTVAPPPESVDPEDLDEPADETTTTEAPAEEPAEPTPAPEPVEHRFELAARSHEAVRLGDVLAAPVVSALVEAPAGGIVVEHRVTSGHGFDVQPCATDGATTWHFAYGDTTVAARELLVLFNPFPADAIVEARFSTEDGVREPQRFTDGVVVPGRGTVAVDLGDDVTRREEVAASITARTGRVVVDRIVRVDGETDRGLTLQLGVPAPQETWVYPDGLISDEVREEYWVYNPTEELAEVEIELFLDEPEVNGIPESVDLSLPPGAHQVIDVNADGRVPAEVGHSALVRSANGVPVVAERLLFASGEDRRGITASTGTPVESERWSFAAGAVTESTDEWIVLVNLDPQVLAEIDVTAVVGGREVPVEGLQGLEVGPGRRAAIRIGERISGREQLSLVVTSTEPIAVERGLYAVGEGRGMSNAVGVPSAVGLRLPIDPLSVEVADDLGEVPTEGEGDEAPEAPDDVELPEPDETIVIDDPDAEAEQPDDGG